MTLNPSLIFLLVGRAKRTKYNVTRMIRVIRAPERIRDAFINKINTNPDTETIVESTVHVANVSFMLNPKYSLIIQNPASFTCEQIALPAPVASVTKAKFTSYCASIGITNPAVEIAATVADPKEIRKIAATNHARIIGDIEVPANSSAT